MSQITVPLTLLITISNIYVSKFPSKENEFYCNTCTNYTQSTAHFRNLDLNNESTCTNDLVLFIEFYYLTLPESFYSKLNPQKCSFLTEVLTASSRILRPVKANVIAKCL